MNIALLAAGRYSPARIPGLCLWLDASRGVENAAGGDAVELDPIAAWRDRSGQANDASQPTASRRPVYRTEVVAGRPAARFDGVDDLLSLASHLTQSEGTIFAVASDTSAGSGERALLSGEALSLYAQVQPGSSRNWGSYAAADILSGVDLQASHAILALVIRAPDDIDLVTNGVPVTATNGVGWPARPASAVGADGSGVQPHAGDLCELLFYDRPLAEGERRRVERYLSRRYGLPLSA